MHLLIAFPTNIASVILVMGLGYHEARAGVRKDPQSNPNFEPLTSYH